MTRTPVWLLWLVVMTPAIIWMLWAIAFGNTKPLPTWLIWVPFVVCLALYWKLLYAGRILPPADTKPTQPALPPVEATPVPPPALEPTRPINADEEKSLQTCFPWSIYYLQQIDYRPQAVICRGQLRSQPDVAYKTIRDNVEGIFGNRFFVIFQEGLNGKPFFALVPNTLVAANSQQPALSRPAIALGLLLITGLTTALGWTQLQGQRLDLTVETVANGLPYAATLLGILGMHELGHYLAARRYKIRVTLPAFIPIIPMPLFPFGTFGAFTQMRSPIPHRRALFDVGLAGPLWGGVIALPLLLWGLRVSTVVPHVQASPSTFQAIDPNISILLTLFSKLVWGDTLTPDTALHLHPIALASCLGLIITAYNLMPVGPLDGGRMMHAMFGQRTGAIIGQIFRLLLLGLSFLQQHLLICAILLLLLPAVDEPALNDVTDLDNRRDLWGLLAMGILLLIILPTPGFLSRLLNV